MKYFILSVIFLFTTFEVFAGGLKFKGNTHPIDLRTSYDVFDQKVVTFNEFLEIEFSLSLFPDIDRERDSGYIIRIKNRENNRIFNVFYDGRGENNFIFRLNEEGKQSLINADFDREKLKNQIWFKVNILFDFKTNSITLSIGNMSFSSKIDAMHDSIKPVIMFGKSDHVIDIPEFAIRDLKVGNNKKHHFILNEHDGSKVHDIKGREIGVVNNAEWLINDAYRWKLETSFYSPTIAGSNFNSKSGEIYFFNKDSIIIHHLQSSQTRKIIFDEESPVKLELGTNFIDTLENKLYSYEVYYDNSVYEGPSVASLDLSTFNWSIESYDRLPRQFHHHTSFYDTHNRQYIIFGGFGNMQYSNAFYAYSIDNKNWQLIDFENNDKIHPRYFTSTGYSEADNTVYLFGGMGNESGEQLLGREYYYELFKIDLNNRKIYKEWEIEWSEDNVVPVRDLIIDKKDNFYTLSYPEYFSNSFLKLFKYSIQDGDYVHVGDSIEIYSDRISTHANLYYDKNLEKLYALIHHFEDDIASELNIYSIDFPPVTKKELISITQNARFRFTPWSLILLLVIFSLFAFLIYNRIRKESWKKNVKSLIKEDMY